MDGCLRTEYLLPFGGTFKCSITMSYEALEDVLKQQGSAVLTPLSDARHFQLLGRIDASLGPVPVVHNSRLVIPPDIYKEHRGSLYVVGVEHAEHDDPLYALDQEYDPQGWVGSFMRKDTSLPFSRSAIRLVERQWLGREGRVEMPLAAQERAELDRRGWVSFDDKVAVVRMGRKHQYLLLEPTPVRELVNVQYSLIKSSVAESRIWDELAQDKGFFSVPNAERFIETCQRKRQH